MPLATVDATLIAACIAAAAAMLSLCVSTWALGRAEQRAAQRQLLGDVVIDLGIVIHKLMAWTTRQRDALDDDATTRALILRNGAETQADALDELRRKLRYPLPDLNDAFNELKRLPHRLSICIRREERAELVRHGCALSHAIHRGVSEAWMGGTRPRRRTRRAVARQIAALRGIEERPDLAQPSPA